MQNENVVSQTNGSRCQSCRKKSIIMTKCSCENNFCLSCRYPDIHKCTFDFKEKARKSLEKTNPIVIAEKIVKI